MQNTNVADKNAEQTEQQAVSHPPTHFVDDGRLPYDHLDEIVSSMSDPLPHQFIPGEPEEVKAMLDNLSDSIPREQWKLACLQNEEDSTQPMINEPGTASQPGEPSAPQAPNRPPTHNPSDEPGRHPTLLSIMEPLATYPQYFSDDITDPEDIKVLFDNLGREVPTLTLTEWISSIRTHVQEKQPSQPIAGFGLTNISEPAITATNSMIDFMELHRQIIKDTRVFPEPRERRGYTGRILREIHGSRLHHDILFPAPVLANSDLPATTSASSSILTPRTDLYSGPGYAGSRVTTVVTTRQIISHDEAAEEQTLLVPPQPTIPMSAATSFSSSASSSENPWLLLDASSSASSSENPWLLLDDTIDDAGAELTTNRRVQSAATAEPADPTMQKRQLATVTCCILL